MHAFADNLRDLATQAKDATWAGTRTQAANYSHAMACVRVLEDMGVTRASKLTSDDLKAVAVKLGEAAKPATVTRYLTCFKQTLGDQAATLKWPWPKMPRHKKWWLPPASMTTLLPQLRDAPDATDKDRLLADFIEWTCHTGLRVEESVGERGSDEPGVVAGDFAQDFATLHVRGTKSYRADRHIALDRTAATLAMRRLGGLGDPALRLFPTNYDALVLAWERVRFLLKLDHPTATLKALRRSAAWYRTVEDGMPAQVLQHYLGHAKMDTTMEYLRLTGDAFGVEVQRRWIRT